MISGVTIGAVRERERERERESYTLVNRSEAFLSCEKIFNRVYVKFDKYRINKIELIRNYYVC